MVWRGRKGGREGGREGGKEGKREGGKEGEGGGEREITGDQILYMYIHVLKKT